MLTVCLMVTSCCAAPPSLQVSSAGGGIREVAAVLPPGAWTEVPPWIVPAGEERWALLTTGHTVLCPVRKGASPLTDADAFDADRAVRVTGSSVVDRGYPSHEEIADEPYWLRNYYGVFSAVLMPDCPPGECVILGVAHGENKNERVAAWADRPERLYANSVDPTIGGGPDDYSGYDANGVYHDYWPAYFAFVGMVRIRIDVRTQKVTEVTDLGPVAWPSAGYIDATGSKRSSGLRHPSCIIKDRYIYIYYIDTSDGAEPGRGWGVKAVRAPIEHAFNPAAYRGWYEDAFAEPSLPVGFDRADPSFLRRPGGRTSPVIPQGLDAARFTPIKLTDQPWFVAVASHRVEEEPGAWEARLYASEDLLHWGPALPLPETRSASGTGLGWYPALANASMTDMTRAESTELQIVGTESTAMRAFGVRVAELGSDSARLPVRVPLTSQWDVEERPAGRPAVLQVEDLAGGDAAVGPWEVHTLDTQACGAALRLVCTPEREDLLHLRFHGTRIQLYGTRSRWTGQIGWRIEGGDRSGVIDAYCPREAVHQDLLLSVAGLPDGAHTLTLHTLQEGYQKHSPWWRTWQFWLDFAETDGHFTMTGADAHDVVDLAPEASWTTSFRGDQVALRIRPGPGCTPTALLDGVEAALRTDEAGLTRVGGALGGDPEDLRGLHRLRIDALGGGCAIEALHIQRRRTAQTHVHEVALSADEPMRLAGVVTEQVAPVGVEAGSHIGIEAMGADGTVLASGGRWFLAMPEPDAATPAPVRLRFTLTQGDAKRSPVLREVHLLWVPVEPIAAKPGVRIGTSPNAHADAVQAVRLGIGDLLWVEKPGMFPVSRWHENPKVDVFRSAALCSREGLDFVVSGRRGLGDFIRPVEAVEGWIQDTTPDIYDAQETGLLRAVGGARFVGFLMEEMDTSMVQGGLRDESMAEFPDLYGFTDRRGGRLAYEREIRAYADRYRAWGADALVNCGVTYPSASYRAGADVVVAELQCMMVCNNVQLACLRGASHQFGQPFGAWVSLWYKATVPCEDPELPLARGSSHVGGPEAGYSAGEMRRSLFASVYSGAAFAMVQDAVPMYTDFDRDGVWELSSRGEALRGVHEHARDLSAIRPHKGAALLLDKDCGYSPGHLWDGFASWTHWEYRHGNPLGHVWGKLRPGRPERMLRDALDVVYPGWDRAGLDKHPGTFTDTPYGPVDVVESDISLDRLAAYDAVILVGAIELDPELDRVLSEFVAQGGMLDLNAAHLRAVPETARLLGVAVGEPRDTALSDGTPVRAYALECDSEVQTLHEDAGAPLLVARDIGSGRIVLSLIDYDLTSGSAEDSSLASLARDRIASTVAEVNARRVEATAVSGLEYLPFTYEDGREGLLLMNHAAEPIEVSLRWPTCTADVARDTVSGRSYPLDRSQGDARALGLSLQPDGVSVLRLEPAAD